MNILVAKKDLQTLNNNELNILFKHYDIPNISKNDKLWLLALQIHHHKATMKTGEQNNEAEILAQVTVFESLFQNLDFKEIQNLCATNKKLNENCKEPLFWQKFITKKLKEMVLNDLNKERVFHKFFESYAFEANSPIGDAFIAAAIKVGNFNKDYLEELLIGSSEVNYIKSLKILIQKGVNPNAQDLVGRTGLMFASYNGHLEIVKELIKAGVNLNIKEEKDGKTALMFTVHKGQLQIVKELIKAGVDLNIKDDRYGDTALLYAIKNNKRFIAEELIKAGTDINIKYLDERTALIFAIQFNNHPNIVKLLLDAGADPNINIKSDTCWSSFTCGETALMIAVRKNRLQIVKLLLNTACKNCGSKRSSKKGSDADPNIQNREGATALMIAVMENRLQIVKLLLNTGADPNIQNREGATALMLACETSQEADYLKIVNEFINAGANINIKDKKGDTAIDTAIDYANYDIVQLLKNYKGGVNSDSEEDSDIPPPPDSEEDSDIPPPPDSEEESDIPPPPDSEEESDLQELEIYEI